MKYEVFGNYDDFGHESLGIFLEKDFVDSFMAGQRRRFIYDCPVETVTFKKEFGRAYFYRDYSYSTFVTDVYLQIFNTRFMKLPDAVAAALVECDHDYGTEYRTNELMRGFFYTYARSENAWLLREMFRAAGHTEIAKKLADEKVLVDEKHTALGIGLTAMGVADEPEDYLKFYELVVDLYGYVLKNTKDEYISFYVDADFPNFAGYLPNMPTRNEIEDVLRKYKVDPAGFFAKN